MPQRFLVWLLKSYKVLLSCIVIIAGTEVLINPFLSAGKVIIANSPHLCMIQVLALKAQLAWKSASRIDIAYFG